MQRMTKDSFFHSEHLYPSLQSWGCIIKVAMQRRRCDSLTVSKVSDEFGNAADQGDKDAFPLEIAGGFMYGYVGNL